MPEEQLISWLKNWQLDLKWKKDSLPRPLIEELINIAIKHYIEFQALHRYLINDQIPISNFDIKECPIEKWLTKYKNKFNQKSLDKVYKVHQEQHQLAHKIIDLIKAKKHTEASKQFKEFEEIRKTILKNLLLTILKS